MTFHESKDFKDALYAAAKHLKMRPVLVEKDYWVTYILSNLSKSELSKQVVFKGGTSLSKAYNCIQRFSEDIDLAILDESGLSDNQLNKIIKAVEKDTTKGLAAIDDHLNVVKKGRNRTTVYKYPKVLTETDFGAVKDVVQLEINSFTKPVPHETREITSYVAQFLMEKGEAVLLKEFHLHPFTLQVLSPERTFFEKLLSINRLSYHGIDTLKGKIRHFYDLHQLFHYGDLSKTIVSDAGIKILEMAFRDDESNATFAGDWIGKPLAGSPLFSSLESNWKSLIPTYSSDLATLVWSELPPPEAILKVLMEIAGFVKKFDDGRRKQHSN